MGTSTQLDRNLQEMKHGLMSTPRYLSEHLQWLTTEGQELYSKRRGVVTALHRELIAVNKAIKAVSKHMSNNVVIIDLGAGLTDTAISMFNCLLDGNPDRRICYIPVDLNKVIMNWPSHLKSHHPVINERIVTVKPVIMDMLDAVKNTDDLLQGTGCDDWEILYCLFGPISTILPNAYFNQLVRNMQTVLQPRGKGEFVFTYIAPHADIEAQINEEYYNKLDMSAVMKCVILGLNKVAGANVDSDLFEYERTFISDKQTPGIEGKWAGFVIHATAKQDVQFYCENLQMEISLKRGEQIRLSNDIVKAHYYEDRYIQSLANTSGFQVFGKWNEPEKLISSTVYSIGRPQSICRIQSALCTICCHKLFRNTNICTGTQK